VIADTVLVNEVLVKEVLVNEVLVNDAPGCEVGEPGDVFTATPVFYLSP